MTTIAQRIHQRRRPQILVDRDRTYAAIEAALAENDSLAFWLKHIRHGLVRAMRKIRRVLH